MIHYGILAPNRVGTPEDADWPSRSDRRFRLSARSHRYPPVSVNDRSKAVASLAVLIRFFKPIQ